MLKLVCFEQRWAVPSTKVPQNFVSTVIDYTFSKMVPKYRYRGTYFKKVFGIFRLCVITYRLKIKLSLYISANKCSTPKYSVTAHSKERFKVCLPKINM